LETAAEDLPVLPEIIISKLPSALPIVDLMASLHLVLGTASTPEEQENQLFNQVAPLLDALAKY
jgi:hypothetical protein